jgi:hypothetical protein
VSSANSGPEETTGKGKQDLASRGVCVLSTLGVLWLGRERERERERERIQRKSTEAETSSEIKKAKALERQAYQVCLPEDSQDSQDARFCSVI